MESDFLTQSRWVKCRESKDQNFDFTFYSNEEDITDWFVMQAWTLAAGIGCGLMAHFAARLFSTAK